MSETFESLLQARRDKLEEIRASGNAYPNDFKINSRIEQINKSFANHSKEDLERWSASQQRPLQVAGRLRLKRIMGKLSFAHIADENSTIQLYLSPEKEDQAGLPLNEYAAFKDYDLGDIIGVTGLLCRTKKGELSIRATSICLLTKSLLPMPDKHHGLTDREIRSRQRYLDLIVNPESMQTFQDRSAIVTFIRRFMERENYTEVETPMMHPIPGGANARPFVTHHNALNMELYLRIAPELYLKRLIVGGFRKVFEINRNFRNEGLSPRHNPEFTMMEFYWAYADYLDLIVLISDLLRDCVQELNGDSKYEIPFGEHQLNFQIFDQMTMVQAVQKYVLKEDPAAAETFETLKKYWETHIWNPSYEQHDEGLENAGPDMEMPSSYGEAIAKLFEEYVEHQLIQPTFITQFPIEVSPLARRNDEDPRFADRFELFIAGQEIANGFSELNDPDDQAARFQAQVDLKSDGDNEAMHYDDDYITALQYGMPPTAGAGIGIDRLIAILLNKDNIRDVILFPHMRPSNS
jgi:lysyl-tRNA synthetase class 2